MFRIILFLLLFSFNAHAVEWVTANMGGASWNAPTLLENGDPIPAESVIKYFLYRKMANGVKEKVGETVDLQATFLFVNEGEHFIGVSAARFVDEKFVNESSIVWSDVADIPFGFIYYVRSAPVEGLRK